MKRSSQWETISHNDILDCFPIMSEEDIGDLTFGNKYCLEFPYEFIFV